MADPNEFPRDHGELFSGDNLVTLARALGQATVGLGRSSGEVPAHTVMPLTEPGSDASILALQMTVLREAKPLAEAA